MSTTPTVDPDLFKSVFAHWASGTGPAYPDPKALSISRETLSKLSGGRATEHQVRLAAIAQKICRSAREFRALLARFEAFMDLTANAERQAVWAANGWLKLSPGTVGEIAPASFLLTIASTCPLEAGAAFSVTEFELRATRLAKASGLCLTETGMATIDQSRKLRDQFWRVHAPLIALSAAIMWGVWFALVGNTWPAWVAAIVPILGGIAHIYPRSQK